MPFSAGTRLGPYEILAPIGKGGMGEVYRANDTRLRREVAIKVSVERFSERFEREARAIASLNHPNICSLYDVGPNYLVMELVEGENLKGPVPLETALNYARQIADALEEEFPVPRSQLLSDASEFVEALEGKHLIYRPRQPSRKKSWFSEMLPFRKKRPSAG